jgi:hypothetical protein
MFSGHSNITISAYLVHEHSSHHHSAPRCPYDASMHDAAGTRGAWDTFISVQPLACPVDQMEPALVDEQAMAAVQATPILREPFDVP